MAAGFSDNPSQMPGHTSLEVWEYSRNSVNIKVGCRRKEKGKMDLHPTMNWGKNLSKS